MALPMAVESARRANARGTGLRCHRQMGELPHCEHGICERKLPILTHLLVYRSVIASMGIRFGYCNTQVLGEKDLPDLQIVVFNRVLIQVSTALPLRQTSSKLTSI